MKKRMTLFLPFLIMPMFTPIYKILDSIVFVEVFGCGCVPGAQTNMLNIPFNANDLRLVVFSILTIILSVWSFFISKNLSKKFARIFYCIGTVLFNIILTCWIQKTMVWG